MRFRILIISVCLIVVSNAAPVIAETNSIAGAEIQTLWWQDALMQTNIVRLYDYDAGALGQTSIQGGSSSFRDAQGRLRGKAIRQRNASNFYDAENTYVGRATVSGNTTYFYDENGNLSGKVVKLGNVTMYYDKKGNMISKATRDSLGNLRFQKSPKASITSGTGSSGTIQK